MKKRLSTGKICLLVALGTLISPLSVTAAVYAATENILVLKFGLGLTLLFFVWLVVLILLLRHRLSAFTDDLCQTLDNMMNGESIECIPDSETLFHAYTPDYGGSTR